MESEDWDEISVTGVHGNLGLGYILEASTIHQKTMTCTYTISKSFLASPLDRQRALSSLIIQLQGLYTNPVYFLRSTISNKKLLTDSKAVANRSFTPLFTLGTSHSLLLFSAASDKTPLRSQNVQPSPLKRATGHPRSHTPRILAFPTPLPRASAMLCASLRG